MIRFDTLNKDDFIDDFFGELDLHDMMEEDIEGYEGASWYHKLINAPVWLRNLYTFKNFLFEVFNGGIPYVFVNYTYVDLAFMFEMIKDLDAKESLKILEEGYQLRSEMFQLLGRDIKDGNLVDDYDKSPLYEKLLSLDKYNEVLTDEMIQQGFTYFKKNVGEKYKK